MRRTKTGVMLAWFWLGLLGAQCQALTLGDLAVSSRPSPNFIASVPLVDQSGIRVSDLMTRLATAAEYAQRGLQAPEVLRELRVRIVPASQTLAYLEFYSTSTLSQSSFDLLVWASYAGQTSLTSYKVELQELPSLIKGKTFNASPSLSQGWRQTQPGSELKDKHASPPPINTPLAERSRTDAAPDVDFQSTSGSKRGQEPMALAIDPLPVERPLADTPTAKTSKDVLQPSDPMAITGLAIVLSLTLFVVGFLLGRLRKSQKMQRCSTLNPQSDSAKALGKSSLSPKQPTALWPHAKVASETVPAASTASSVKTPVFLTPLSKQHQKGQSSSTPQPLAKVTPQAIVATPPPQAVGTLVDRPAQEALESLVLDEKNADPHHEMQAPVEPITAELAHPAGMGLRAPATALPTPGFQAFGAPRKVKKAKSAETEKIDLAKIYLSMGDPATARLLLEQAFDSGTDTEKASAQELMRSIN
jgi:FimV-like protein